MDFQQELASTDLYEKTSVWVEMEVVFTMDNGTEATGYGYSEVIVRAVDATYVVSDRMVNFALKEAVYKALLEIKADLNNWN